MLIRSIQLIASVSLIILIHELGHYILAILFKVRVEKFFLFFDPWFSIFKKKIGNTTYGIGWIPLGGYIKISGMINEHDKNNDNNNKNFKFYSKSSIKRLLIISGGIIANIILSILIFSFLLFHNGEINLPNNSVPYGIEVDYIGDKIGLKNGDKILFIDGVYMKNFNDITRSLLLGNNAIINRNGKIIKLSLYDKKQIFFDRKKINFLLYPRIPAVINNIIKGSKSEKYGFRPDDELISINYNPIIFQDQVKSIVTKQKNNTEYFTIGINRSGNFIQKKILFNSKKFIGIFLKNFINMNNIFNIEKKTYSINDSFIQGIIKTFQVLKNHILLLKNVFNIKTKAYKQVGSFFSIVKEFSNEWNWYIFFNLTATLSIWIAFLNLIPIPSLDGGYMLFIILEILMGKKISNNILEFFTIIGFLLMGLMMIVVIIWDIFKFFFY